MNTILLGGIDIGGTNIKYGVVDSNGEMIWEASTQTHADDGVDAVVARVGAIVVEITDKYPLVTRIGVGVPGVVDPSQGTVHYPPNLAGWGVVPLREMLSAYTELPVNIENDANAAAIAECRAGSGVGMKDFLYVTLGTGIGGGIVLDGQLYRGPHGDAGEIGHVIVSDSRPQTDERMFRKGVLEVFAGRQGILDVAKEHGIVVDDVADLVTLAESQPTAKDILEETGALIGVGLCSALAVLGLRNVVIGGGIAKSPTIIDAITSTLATRAIPTIAQNFVVKPARFRASTGIYGACFL